MLTLASGHRPYLESCMSMERILSSQQCLTSPENPHLSPSHVAVFNTRDQAVQNSLAFVGSWFWSQGPSMALAPAQDLVGVSLVPFLLRGGTQGQDATSGVPSCHGATCAVTGLLTISSPVTFLPKARSPDTTTVCTWAIYCQHVNFGGTCSVHSCPSDRSTWESVRIGVDVGKMQVRDQALDRRFLLWLLLLTSLWGGSTAIFLHPSGRSLLSGLYLQTC